MKQHVVVVTSNTTTERRETIIKEKDQNDIYICMYVYYIVYVQREKESSIRMGIMRIRRWHIHEDEINRE